MRTAIATVTLTLLAVPATWAGTVVEQPTFNRDVLPILQANCQECHRPKPISLSGRSILVPPGLSLKPIIEADMLVGRDDIVGLEEDTGRANADDGGDRP